MSDSANSPDPGPHTLAVRAAFVPDGEQPPAELSSTFSPLHIPATLDTSTGLITCDNAGTSFNGDVRAEWHPDEDQDSEDGDGSMGAPETDTSDVTENDGAI